MQGIVLKKMNVNVKTIYRYCKNRIIDGVQFVKNGAIFIPVENLKVINTEQTKGDLVKSPGIRVPGLKNRKERLKGLTFKSKGKI